MLDLRRGNISKRSVLIFTFIFLIVIFMTTILSYMSSTKRLKEELNYSNITLLKHISQNIDMKLQEIDREIVSLINEPEVRVFMYENYKKNSSYYVDMYKLLRKMSAIKFSNPNIYSIYLYSSVQDKVLTDTMSFEIDEFYDSGWMDSFSELKEYYQWLDTRSITENFQNIPENKNVITLVRPYPIASHPKNRDGAIIVNINESSLNALITGNQDQRLGQIFLMSKDGSIISHNDKSQLYKELGDEEWVSPILSSTRDGQVDGEMDGVDSLFFYITSLYTRWKYVSVVPHVQINEPIMTIRNIFFCIAIGMFGIAVVMVIIASKWTYKPVHHFVHALKNTIQESSAIEMGKVSLDTFEELEKVFSDVITDYDRARKQIEESIPAIKARLITDILTGYITNYQEVVRHLKLVKVSLNPANFIVMIAELDDSFKLKESPDSAKFHCYTRYIANITEKMLAEDYMGATVVLNEERVAILISFENENSTFAMDVSIALARRVQQQVQEELGITISIGIGSFYREMGDIKKSFHEAREAVKYKIIMGRDSVICIDDIRLFNERELYGTFSSVNSIALAIKMADVQEVCTRIDRLFDEAVEKSLPPDFIRQLGMQLVIEGIQATLDTGLDMEDILEDNFNNVYQTLKFYDTVDQIKEYIEELFIGFIECIRDKRSNNNNNELIDKVLEYIDQHYMENDISLNMLAEIFHISVPYLSTIFKKCVETNFMDYLIKVRIEKAMKLLCGSDKKINEIAREVGYTNAHSFIRVFKKYVGKTPGEFRNDGILRSAYMNKEMTSL